MRKKLMLFPFLVVPIVCCPSEAEDAKSGTCGPNCIFLMETFCGMDTSYSKILQRCHLTHSGMNMRDLQAILIEDGLFCEARRYNLEQVEMEDLAFPCIAHLSNNHYIVCYYRIGDGVLVADPPSIDVLPFTLFKNLWDGLMITVQNCPYPCSERRKQLVANESGVKWGVSQLWLEDIQSGRSRVLGVSDADARIQKVIRVLDRTTNDHGRIGGGEVISGTFTFQNISTERVEVAYTAASCSCAKAECDSQSIAPSGVARVQYSVDTGALDEGPFRIFVYVSLAGIPGPVKFGIAGTTYDRVVVRPKEIAVDEISSSELVSEEFCFNIEPGSGSANLHIKGVSTTSSLLDARFEGDLSSGSAYQKARVKLRVGSGLPAILPSNLNESIILSVENMEKPGTVEIPFSIDRIVGGCQLVPQDLFTAVSSNGSDKGPDEMCVRISFVGEAPCLASDAVAIESEKGSVFLKEARVLAKSEIALTLSPRGDVVAGLMGRVSRRRFRVSCGRGRWDGVIMTNESVRDKGPIHLGETE